MLLQAVPVGSYWTWPNPLAALAVIEPVTWVVRSLMVVTRPLLLSCSVTFSRSPEFMNRSFVGSGVKVANVALTGLAGAWEVPLFVTNAKLTYSSPVMAAQVEFRVVPLTGSSDRLSMLSAAHHLVASQLFPAGHVTQPGG